MPDYSDPTQAGPVWSRRGFMGALGLLAAGSGVGCAGSLVKTDDWRSQFPGRTVIRGEEAYESWRLAMPWQMYTAPRYPDLIARPEAATGVAHMLDVAKTQGQRVALKSGGHNVAESFLRDGGMLLDLGELQGVEVNAMDGTAWVEPALWSHGLLQAIEAQGFAFPVAHCATVPMGGYLLGGGLGYNHDNWGSLACHSILAAEVVLANGETVIASPDSYPDLYWAVRGAGTGFFGVVIRYKLQLYPAPAAVHESAYIYPLAKLAEATGMLQDWADSNPVDTELMMLLAHNPMAAPGASALDSKMCIVRAVAYSESRAKAEAQLKTLGSHPGVDQALMKNEAVPTSLKQMQEESVDANMGLGFGRYAVDTIWTDKLPDVMAAIKTHFTRANSVKTHFVVSPKLNRTLPRDDAFSVIGDTFVGAYTMWDEAEQDEASFAWLDGASALMRPLAVGQYINEVDAFRDPSVVRRCFTDSAWQRLAALRERYDPEGLFVGWPGQA